MVDAHVTAVVADATPGPQQQQELVAPEGVVLSAGAPPFVPGGDSCVVYGGTAQTEAVELSLTTIKADILSEAAVQGAVALVEGLTMYSDKVTSQLSPMVSAATQAGVEQVAHEDR